MKAVILAAGRGTRLQSEGIALPKVMREVKGRPLLSYVLDALSFIPIADKIIVVGYEKEVVMEAFPENSFAIQLEQKGTGHAVMSARDLIGEGDIPVLVCCGDMPLLRHKTYAALVAAHKGNACTILTGTTTLDLPFGRILRDENGKFQAIVEEKDCTAAQKKISECNSGVYIFQAQALFAALAQVCPNNSQGEYYLTDVPAILQELGFAVETCVRDLGTELLGVNTIEDLRMVERLL